MYKQVRSAKVIRQKQNRSVGKVKIALYKDTRGAMPAVSISEDVVKSLGWKIGDRLTLLTGSDHDYGTLNVIVKPEADGFELSQKKLKKAVEGMVRFPPAPNLGISTNLHPLGTAQYEVKGDTLVITPPSWFWSQAYIDDMDRIRIPHLTHTILPNGEVVEDGYDEPEWPEPEEPVKAKLSARIDSHIQSRIADALEILVAKFCGD